MSHLIHEDDHVVIQVKKLPARMQNVLIICAVMIRKAKCSMLVAATKKASQ